MQFQKGAKLPGGYTIEATIGEGGAGVVYLADGPKGRVAVKIPTVSSQKSEAAMSRFATECRVLASLRHPHLVRVYDCFEFFYSYVLVMEYLPFAVSEMLSSHARFTVERALDIGIGICGALDCMHGAGIIHRDVKPSNILARSKKGTFKLGDLGIAHVPTEMQLDLGERKDSSTLSSVVLTMVGQQPGTLPYMSPEQVRGESASVSSDIYSLGATLYEMLTGRSYLGAYDRKSADAIAVDILDTEPKGCRAYDPTIPKNVERAVLKALRKKQGDRFRRATEFGLALRKCLKEMEVDWSSTSKGTKGTWNRKVGSSRLWRRLSPRAIVESWGERLGRACDSFDRVYQRQRTPTKVLCWGIWLLVWLPLGLLWRFADMIVPPYRTKA